MKRRDFTGQLKHPLAIMAHDIKAPLSAIINLLSVIEKGYINDAEKSKELVGRAGRQAVNLLRMIDDILDYTLLSGKAKIECEMIDLPGLLNESIATMKQFIDERKITFKLHIGAGNEYCVCGNRTFLLRVFNNLLMNAIKYNKPGGSIFITMSGLGLFRKVSVCFEDSGIGIDREDLKKVFNIFERGKNARKNIDGSIGLGLALVKQIVADHNGSIKIWSKLNVGTKITVILPLTDTGGQ
jgi:two-component system phosphate regulon sensor histidine kinase PhoR